MSASESQLAISMREGELSALLVSKKLGRQAKTILSRPVWEAYHKRYGANNIILETRIIETEEPFCVSYVL